MNQAIMHVRNQMPKPYGDERGITLQTLIVTAVLVLMAVAAGVIIAAITNSSSDDLEEQSQDLDALCAPWELHDPVYEANAAGGGGEYTHTLWFSDGRTDSRGGEAKPGRGGVTSSKIGCLPVCYLKLSAGHKTLDDFRTGGASNGSDIQFDTGNEAPDVATIRIGVTYVRQGERYAPAYQTELNPDGTWNSGRLNNFGTHSGKGDRQLGTNSPPTTTNLIVRVADNKESCVIYDTSKSEVVYPRPSSN